MRKAVVGLLIIACLVGVAVAAYSLTGKIPVRVVEPFQLTRETVLVTLYPGTNATQTFLLENFLDRELTVTVSTTTSDPGVLLWDPWPQTFILTPLEARTVTVSLGASDTLPAGDYQINYTAVWVPS